MLLSQMLSKDKEAVQYRVENLTPKAVYFSVYRKKVVLMGSAPVERLTVPQLIQAGDTGSVTKPDIKLPWKRYILISEDEEKLHEHVTDKELAAMVNIWSDEINTAVLTEELQEDGMRVIKAASWAAWSARKKLAPVKYKYTTTKEAFLSDMHGKMIAGMEPHLYSKQEATVRHGSELASEELQFLEMRSRVTSAAIAKLTGLDLSSLPSNRTPRISVCASGGGYRAMVATLGAMIAMEETGLLDCVTSMAGLSGSTWAMAAWYAGGRSLPDTRLALAEKMGKPFYTNKLWPDTVKSHVKERMGFDQECGLVDVMGWHLYNHLLKDLPAKQELWHKPRLSEQSFLIADGSRPLPIYTAVAHEHKRYRWFEFTPFEVGLAQDINIFVPTWSFGRKFHEGKSLDFAVEPSLALLQATWGSAFCATVDQMMHEMDDGSGAEPALYQRLLHTLVYDKLELAEDRLITPAKYPNMGHGVAALGPHPWREMKTLKLMDAGVHTNLPFPPLLRSQRQTDIIIALDQSSAPDIFSSVSMDIVQRFAVDEKMPFPDCTAMLATDPEKKGTPQEKHSFANGRRVTVVPGDVARGIPTVIYMPLLRNDNFDKEFCPRENALTKGGYCSTFNFHYTSDQVMQLSGLTEQNIKASLAEITQVIKDVTQAIIAFEASKPAGDADAHAAAVAASSASV